MKKEFLQKVIIIILIMVLAILIKNPIVQGATTVETYQAGANITATLDDEGTLTFTGTGKMTDWGDSTDVPWYSVRNNIKKVIINDGIENIGSKTFYYCSSLQEITIPNSVTSIGVYAFYGCSNLQEITIPSSVTRIENEVFEYCSSLQEITVDVNNNYFSSENGILFNKERTRLICYPAGKNENTYNIPSSVTSIGDYAFSVCRSLQEITIPSSVTSIGRQAFYRCSSLQEITVDVNNNYFSSENGILFNKEKTRLICYPAGKNENTYNIPSSVTSIGNYAFDGCGNLQEISIPTSVRSIGMGAFFDCSSLQEISIPSSVTRIEIQAFLRCSSLQEITIPSSVTSIGSQAFFDCSSLQEITIPSSVTSIGSQAFFDCSSLQEISIPTSVTSIGENLLKNSYKAIIVTEKESNADTYAQENKINRITYSTMDKTDQDVELELNGEKIYTFTKNGEYEVNYRYTDSQNAMQTDKIVAKVDWIYKETYQAGENITAILDDEGTLTFTGTGAMTDWSSSTDVPWYSVRNNIKKVIINNGIENIGSKAFFECRSLQEITIPTSVTSIGGYAFYYCSSLQEISIPTSVTSIKYGAFEHCSSLQEISIPNSVTSIGNYAFRECSSLQEITVDVNNNYFSSENGILFNKEKTKLICYPAGKNENTYNIPNSVTSIGDYAFYACSSLQEISIPTSVTNIGSSAFEFCSSLQEIIIPNSVTSIKSYTFFNCSSLQEISIPNSVTSISNDVFRGCSSLQEISIPSSVTSIGIDAFYNCSSLQEISIPNSVTRIGSYAFYGCKSLQEISIPSSVTSIGENLLKNSYKAIIVTEKGSKSDAYAQENKINRITYSTMDKTNQDVELELNGEKIYTFTKNGEYEVNYQYIDSQNTTQTDKIVAKVDWIYKEKETYQAGENITATLDDDGTLTFTGTGAMTDWSSSTDVPWYSVRDNIKKIIINDGIENIGRKAFYGCSSLQEITIPTSVTSIGDEAFYKCSSLQEITIPNSVTSIGDYAFARCSNLQKISIPTSVTSIGYEAFFECSSLQEISIPSSVTSIGDYAFYGCSSLKEINIPSSVTSIGNKAFTRCSNLQEISIPSSVISIGNYAFDGCDNLQEISISTSVTSIGENLLKNSYKAIIVTEKGSNADAYAQENKINRITYSTMDKTNQDVELELNGEKIYTFTKNGEYEVNYQYTDSQNAMQTAQITAKVNWIEDINDEDKPNEDGSNEDKPNEDGSNEDKPNEDDSNENKPNEDGSNEDKPNEDGSNEDDSNENKPNEDDSNENKSNENNSNVINSDENSLNKNTLTNQKSSTTSTTVLPYAGIQGMLVIGIIIMVTISAISYYKYKKTI